MTPVFSKSNSAFTLSEMLIVLFILGVIATYTIPKVLQSEANARKMAVFKETIAALNVAFSLECMQGHVTEANFGTTVINQLNAIKVCSTNALTEQCWTQADVASVPQRTRPGVVLASGATVAGLDDNVNGSLMDDVTIDWNGAALPNVEGDDQIVIAVNLGISTSRPCTIRNEAGAPVSNTLFFEIFK